MFQMNPRPRVSAIVRSLTVGVATICCGVASANADYQGPLVTLDWAFAGGPPTQFVMHQHSDDMWYSGNDNAWVFQGGDFGPNGAWGMEWEVQASDGAGGTTQGGGGVEFVNANLAVTNNSGAFQSFTALVTLSLPSQFTGGTLMSGLVSASVQDVQDNGAELRTADNLPIYQAFIDGGPPNSPVATLLDPFFSLVPPVGDTASQSEFFGVPNQVAGPAALDTISVMLHFELSPGDTANVVGSFQIEQMLPAPGALPMLAGLGLILGSRRRRS